MVEILVMPLVAVKALISTVIIILASVNVPLAYVTSFGNDGEPPIELYAYYIDGPYYSSIFFKIPGVDPCWWYGGHEFERSGDIDLNTLAYRCTDFHPIQNLKGNEWKP